MAGNWVKFIGICFFLGITPSLMGQTASDKTPLNAVNPMIGTGGHGHTYPGVSLPFGMVQLSPDTRLEGWDGCSGYHYDDAVIYGFSHTHLSGTGVADYCDVLLMPGQGAIQLESGFPDQTDSGYASRFSHEQEHASPGYYRVLLADPQIQVELTATRRAALHRYTFLQDGPAHVVLDLVHRDPLLDVDWEQVDAQTIRGKRISRAWAQEQYIYFYLQFSQPITTVKTQSVVIGTQAKPAKAAFWFDLPKGGILLVKLGLSAVDPDGAKANLDLEIPDWNFEAVRQAAESEWSNRLSKIQVQGGTSDQRAIFYSALYHSLLNPNLYSDVDGRYRGMDLKIHPSDGKDHYTVFSLWDTFRTTHPLLTLIEPEHTQALIQSLLADYQDGGILPIWPLAGNYTHCMIGYHAIPVIVDAYQKGLRGFDAELAYTAMKHSALQDRLGLDAMKNQGFIPADHEHESVSKTLEYAYDDWCIAQMAKALGQDADYRLFLARAQAYKNLFDPQTSFMRPKMNSAWLEPFDPAEVNFHFTEANSWQYSFFVPQDVAGLVALHGGPDRFEAKLDELFETEQKLSGRDQVDITGLIGQYAHGNEPSHHMAYLYNYIGKPEKTQARVAFIRDTMYHNQPDGLSGNEDCGQMSSWYVMSALGFYPVTPGSPSYVLGSPLFEKATIQVGSSKLFEIEAHGAGSQNPFIQSVALNGQPYKKAYLTHADLVKGGKIVFEMGPQPTRWFEEFPTSRIEAHLMVPVPYFTNATRTFRESLTVSLASPEPGSHLFYALDGAAYKVYEHPLVLDKTTTISAYAERNGQRSNTVKATYTQVNTRRKVTLHANYNRQYSAGGDQALVDSLRGGSDFRTGAWQGFQGQDLVVVVDLGEVETLTELGLGCLQDINSWIWYPKQIQFEISIDGQIFEALAPIENDFPANQYGAFTRDFTQKTHKQARYIRMTAKTYGTIPDWHLGKGGEAFIFADELLIQTSETAP
ncbi:MAG: glycoside hydrolase family 92 protein [Acidobacteria bacterium]|nr:glycoside hydrolase family 92 protein [Acidobacteriota bacterium]